MIFIWLFGTIGISQWIYLLLNFFILKIQIFVVQVFDTEWGSLNKLFISNLLADDENSRDG